MMKRIGNAPETHNEQRDSAHPQAVHARRFLRTSDAASLTEYAILLACLVLIVAASIFAMAGSMRDTFDSVAKQTPTHTPD